ncbi:hypothetical protein EII20_02170 [Comamonadaceae bacterium OH2545_COT-014]|nr:hypothetical protein EII20_02170 [Comamonadaceae bacterium OH2545_COT-014]
MLLFKEDAFPPWAGVEGEGHHPLRRTSELFGKRATMRADVCFSPRHNTGRVCMADKVAKEEGA